MQIIQETELKSAACTATFICEGPVSRPARETIYPILEHGTEILHVLSGPMNYEVYAKMGGLLYSLGNEVQHVLTRNGGVMLRNRENKNNRGLFTIPGWLFHQDFVPTEATL